MRRFIRWFLVMGIAAPALPLRAEVFTVGADAACTHSSVLAAVLAAVGNGAAMDEVRIATNMNHDGVIAPIASQNVHFRGGFSDCADTTASGRTILSGTTSGANGTFSTSGTTGSYTLILENLELRDAGNVSRRGGALRVEDSFTVELRNVLITANLAGRGGGVYVDGSDGGSVVLTSDTSISSNTATVSGGGVFCQNGGVVLMTSGSISSNTAQDTAVDPLESGNGGGVALYGCTMIQVGQGGSRGIRLNTAARHGGGYYLRNGAQLTLDGNSTGPARVESNEAADTGGGIAINDTLPAPNGGISTVIARNSWIDSNRAQYGAGLGLLAGGSVTLQRNLDVGECHNGTYCSSLSFNDKTSAATSCLGAAVFAGEAAQVRLRSTYIEENCISDGGWAFRQRLDSQIRVDSSVIARNGGSSPFFIDGNGATSGGVAGFTGLLEVAWSTVAGHFESVRSSLLSVPSGSPNSTGTIRMYGSLLAEPFLQMTTVGGPGLAPPMTLTFDCLVLDSLFAGSSAAMRSFETSPPYGMANPAGNNYRLSGATATPVDLCDSSLGARANGDADLVTTVFDAPRANVFGPNDIGAYEFAVVVVDPIFSNDFE
jgi:predicted outer membrane repeat protein